MAKTKSAVREWQPIDFDVRPDWYDVALPLLTPELREKVLAGEYYIREPGLWRTDTKPVVVNRKKNLVTGSGQMFGVPEQSRLNQIAATKNRRGYRALVEDLLPPNMTRDNENAIMSFKELIENMLDACLGSAQQVTCTKCGDKFQTAFKKDAATLYKVFENLNGKARETQDINVSSHHLAVMLNERTPVPDIQVRVLGQEELDARKQIIIDHE